jgi:serine phosphatase RsbU (regulator of sigma subunit)
MWSEVIYEPYRKLCQDILERSSQDINSIIDHLAELFYSDIRRSNYLLISPFPVDSQYCDLTEDEKSFWRVYITRIPEKLKTLNLYLRPYNDFCRTCLIPDSDIEILARMDYLRYEGQGKTETKKKREKPESVTLSFERLPEKKKSFYREMNYLIPVIMKKTGFEIIHPEEAALINEKITFKIAKAVHSQYLHLLRKQSFLSEKGLDLSRFLNTGGNGCSELREFDDLPDEIKFSNIDNAYHIPAKLLSIGYKIKHVSAGNVPLALHLNDDEVETMAVVEHIRWCWDKRLNGWKTGKIKNQETKTHPDLIPYEKLPEHEKEKDRELVRLIPALLHDIGYEVCPVNPELIRKLSYAIKPHSSIHMILEETRELNQKIRKLVTLSPEVEEMVRIRNRKIEDAISEVEESYNYARHIQETFLPEDLYIRECFQDSFVLFKPKDIVSGDFYFFSKQNDLIIFAAADCTGHGIPGALLSTLGYGILDQAVNEIRLTDPTEILNHLYSKIHRFLRSDDYGIHISADMDIALCVYNVCSNMLLYSGVNNPLYRITGNVLTEYKAKNSWEICSCTGEYEIISEKIQLEVGDTLYIFSDGFSDQFGGMNHKRYQSSRFRNLLVSVQELSMPEQSDRINEEIERWRDENNEDQTDDIMVIGVRI